ncbi:MFS transporter [Streptomyces radicis]|uniref:MFS transporter n=1 Tax=Streptomyces radicis TaxID=1750517 RepID=A0A3A9W6Q2_9ACTN|nr:MFS transporter [Streptomyces radicis]RKN04964.1 MFS transporter [Streptomyces radicis]RKN16333.1 MFS transporter [Streptomyces radicis]
MKESDQAREVGEAREVRDCYGRRHRVGETDRELLGGRGRRWMLWLPTAAMAGAGVLQYGYPLTALARSGTGGLGRGAVLAVLALWTVCQAAAVPLAERLCRGGALTTRGQVAAGGAACALALALAAVAVGGDGGASPGALLAGYALVGGVGAGLVYAACVATAARWHPDRAPAAVALVTAGYACGAVVPLLLVAAAGAEPASVAWLLGAVAAGALAAALACGALLREPPEHWWPADVDPRRWTLDKHLNRSLRRNRPALWETSAPPGTRSGTWRRLYAAVALGSAVLLLDLGALATAFAEEPTRAGALACAALAAGSGLGRLAVGHLAERLGRRRVLTAALVAAAVVQPGVLAGGPVAVVVCAAVAGCATGGCYPVLVGLLRGYFGGRGDQRAFAALYSAKALGGAGGCGLAALDAGASAVALALALAAALAVHTARRPRPALDPLPGLGPAAPRPAPERA